MSAFSTDYLAPPFAPHVYPPLEPQPLPAVAPLTGKDPKAMVGALLGADERALSRLLSDPLPPLNDPIPGGRGKTCLHLAVWLYSEWSTSLVRPRQQDGQAVGRMIKAMLEAGADPTARDRDHLMPSAYACALPRALRDHLAQAALQNLVGWVPEANETRSHYAKAGLSRRAI